MLVPQKLVLMLMGIILASTEGAGSADLKVEVLQIVEKTSKEAQYITPQMRRLDFLLDVAKLEIMLGAPESAQKTLRVLQLPKGEAGSLPDVYNSQVVELWAQSGDFRGAHELAAETLNLRGRFVALSKIGKDQAQAGHLEQARAAAAQMETDFQEAHDPSPTT